MDLINNLLSSFITYTDSIEKINERLSNKKIRFPNFPSEISENIVCYYINKNNKNATWDTKKGDIELETGDKVEVKGYSSDGPASFGPTETWNILYFINCKSYKERKFVIYEINLSNKSDTWKNLKVSKTDTYEKQCLEGRRPRITF